VVFLFLSELGGLENQIQQSGGLLFAASWMAATHLFSPAAAGENANESPSLHQKITATLIQVAVIFFLWYNEKRW